MAPIDIDYQQMEDAAIKIRAARDDIERKLADFQSQVQQLVAEGFITDASSPAFESAWKELHDGVSKTVGGMTGLAGFLHKAAKTFEHTDEKLAKSLKKNG